MDNVQLYNSNNLLLFLEYIAKHYPEISIAEVLDYASISELEIRDTGQWFTQTQVNRFYEILEQKTKNPNLAREVGRFVVLSKASSMIRQYTSSFITPRIAFWMIGKIASTVSRHIIFQVKNIASNKIELVATPKEGIKEKLFQCENRIGLFEGLGKFFTNEYPIIDHTECYHNGNKSCKYTISWKATPAILWKTVSRYTSAISVIASIILFYFLPIKLWLYFFLIASFITLLSFMISESLSKNILQKSIENQQIISEQLINQFNVRYNELALIKEIGEAASSIFDPQELLNFAADSLNKHLHFQRGMLMLANPDKSKLLYISGYGYSPKEEHVLRKTDFSLTKQDSRGVFHLAFHQQKPFIIDNADDIKDDLSERSIHYIKLLGVKSFICVPIIYEGKSEGILAVDNSESETPATQSDLSLLIGVAQQLGISLNNARAHKKIKESEERFRNLSKNAPDIIYQADRDGNIVYVNQAWEELLGHNISYVVGKVIVNFIRQEERQSFMQVFNSIVQNQFTIRDKNFIFINNKDLPRYVTFTGAPDFDSDGNVIGVVGTLKDISRMRSMEAQLLQASKMEALGSLTGGVAHDFNNIIQAIMGYNQIMMTGRKDSATQKKYHHNIQELITRSRELIQQLLLYGRKSDTQLKSININNDVINTINLLSKSIPKAINIESRLSDELLPVVADSNLIGQIIMNLVINARDAMGESGTINIYTNNLTANNSDYFSTISVPTGNYIRLIVTDTGCGMDKDILEHIFEPFFTTKEVGKGTGLGLSVVKQIVQSLNGYIFCDSIPNKGTTFEILLPAADKEIEAASLAEQSVELKHGKEKLLIVDDESYVLETVKDTLSSYGYKILTADSIDEALKTYSAKKDKIKLVLLDLNMPGSGGKKSLLDILAINKKAKILMTSGYTTKAQIDDFINTGASGFIIKPYRTEELLVSIRNILDSTSSIN
jgi:PAS domain S-box-containing protein